MAKKQYVIIGGDTFVWPAAADTITVVYQPGRSKDTLPDGYVLIIDAAADLAGAFIESFDNQDVDGISGTANGAPISIFARDSVVNRLRLRAPDPATPPTATYRIGVPPVADAAFTSALVPPDVLRWGQARMRRAVKTASTRMAKRAMQKTRRSWLSRLGSGAKNVLRAIWRRLPGVAGIGDMADDELNEVISQELQGESVAMLGFFQQEMLGALEDMPDAEVDEMLGNLDFTNE